MPSEEWIAFDTERKRKDIITYIKTNTEDSSENRILLLERIDKASRDDIIDIWIFIPDVYKTSELMGV